ncbi:MULTISPECIES: M23 family metallopeptidase [unclassified Shewanella]|uniref:M23 family metallopeptidase n=1 Tax=unclassified Shewanella TaxID=196818 RepID=UPI000C865FBC|nr:MULTISPECIES: M23 family metallopeptidase [unclassified Shewanella]MDO6620681.1 M23 family metallopeptidase [Shewanella sp. 6_MG-2023]MDO6777024.1 M23 family metallopeptidase [Shewanella sp. 3_MG-2023]PMG28780.1 peptidase [Shewanella sp. 10N.286.52.C2]PMH88092.1 peptidase [Shewanella sp. 10N.286.48.B5]PMI01936.1 peptidase [Shewanella sp. 10N.286.48.A6]
MFLKGLKLSSLVMVTLFSVASYGSINLQGKLEQGALVRGTVPAGSAVKLNGEVVKVTPKGQFAIGFEREAKTEQLLEVTYPDGLTQLKPLTIASREYKIDRLTGISKKIMQPDPVAQARAAKDSKQTRAARNVFSEQDAFMQAFIWPVTGRISGVYGSQRVYNGKPGNPHYGVDVARPTGTVVVSPADGVITLSVPDMFYSGGTLIIDHGYGINSTFLHLSKLYAKEGDVVTQGQPLAEIGATGRVTGPHLDWRLNWFQKRLDPVSIVPSMESVLAAENKAKTAEKQ